MSGPYKGEGGCWGELGGGGGGGAKLSTRRDGADLHGEPLQLAHDMLGILLQVLADGPANLCQQAVHPAVQVRSR